MKISEIEIEDFASENTPDSPTWQGAVLGATWANEKLAAHIAELEKENKRLALQSEIISGAYETSQKRVKELEAENKALVSQVDFVRTAFDGLKQLLGTEKDATTANFKVKELEAAIEISQAEQAEMLQLINAILAAEKESNGICDCIDNSGVSYQSAFLAGVLSQMEIIASKNKSA